MNTLRDLNMYLFEQMERLNELDPTSQKAKDEIGRSRAVSAVAKDIVSNANLVLQAKKFKEDSLDADIDMKMLEG